MSSNWVDHNFSADAVPLFHGDMSDTAEDVFIQPMQMTKSKTVYLPVIYKDIRGRDNTLHSAPTKRNLYWSKRSTIPDLMSRLVTFPNLSTKPDMMSSLSNLPNLSTKPDMMSTIPNRSSKPHLMSSLSNLPNLSTKPHMMSSLSALPMSTKRDLYWSKRSQQFPTLPFSTIVRNGKHWSAK